MRDLRVKIKVLQVPKRPHDANVCMQKLILCGDICPQRKRNKEKLRIQRSNTLTRETETLGRNKGKMREQVTT